jgi:diadenosine tetraphosphatase ApaH/serine/threonine PP2A family protein phosphatase
VHGGLGLTVETLEQIAAIARPIPKVEGPLLMDLLWSDPAAHDSVRGIALNLQRLGADRTPDRPPLPGECTTFDARRVDDFCRRNRIHLIVRAHECVMDGFEKFASGRLVTVFSASRYCNAYENAGAILLVDRSLTVIPKLLRPSAATHYGWHDDYTQRPPTPPRNRRAAEPAADGLSAHVAQPIGLRNVPGAAREQCDEVYDDARSYGDDADAEPLDSVHRMASALPSAQRHKAPPLPASRRDQRASGSPVRR